MSNDNLWGDKGPPKKDPPIGTTTEIHFTLDDLLAPALEKELMKRGWSEKYEVVKLQPLLRRIAAGQDSFDGIAITIERTAK